MALALKEQFQIKVVPAYQTADGKKFHEPAEAQSYTRNAMLDSVISAATKERPEFAKLEPVLLRDFLLRVGKHVGAVMAEPLEPQAIVNTTPESEARLVAAVKSAAAAPQTAYLEPGRKLEASGRPRWDTHPLDRGAETLKEAMSNVDAETERQVEGDIAEALRLGGH